MIIYRVMKEIKINSMKKQIQAFGKKRKNFHQNANHGSQERKKLEIKQYKKKVNLRKQQKDLRELDLK
jgi:hypothetical protein